MIRCSMNLPTRRWHLARPFLEGKPYRDLLSSLLVPSFFRVFVIAWAACMTGCSASPEQSAKTAIEQLGGKTRSDKGHVVKIDLRKTRATDDDLAGIRQFPQLDRLALPHSTTDAGMQQLQGLPNLTSLDLQNTQVTDQGLEVLKTMPKLVQVYIHGSKVTPEGAQALNAALPQLTIEKFPVAPLGPDFR